MYEISPGGEDRLREIWILELETVFIIMSQKSTVTFAGMQT